jgi:sortase B
VKDPLHGDVVGFTFFKSKVRQMVKKRKRSLLSNIILVIALVVFLYSAYQIYLIYAEYRKGTQEYDGLIEDVITAEKEEDTAEDTEDSTQTSFQVDFAKLLAINAETVAWIRFEQPEKISYPVVQGPDNSKYLKETFEGKHNSVGAIFMDAVNKNDFADKNTFIYGHNMKNGSMFGQLRKYKNAEFCQENPYFYIYTPDGREQKYQVFAVGIVEDTAESFKCIYANDAEYEQYLKHIQKISPYKTGVNVMVESQIVSLSTCTNVTETQRLVVHGVKISERVIGESDGR